MPFGEDYAAALLESSTPAPWAYHAEPQPGGQTGYHVARVDREGHHCIATFHSAYDAALVCALRNGLDASKNARIASARMDATDPLDRCQVCGDPLGYTALLQRSAGDYVHDDCGAAREVYTPDLQAAFAARQHCDRAQGETS